MNESTQVTELAIQALESAWESGVVDEFHTAIPPEAADNDELLTELACVDLELRIQYDTQTRIEAYTAAFPQLANDDLAILELIRVEYSWRADREDLDAESYAVRFPHLRAQIELMFQLEFNHSGDLHVRKSESDWRCKFCNTGSIGKGDQTSCHACGQPINIGRYELVERVGEGAFGYVYRAKDPKLHRDVAIKIPRASRFLTPEESERFLRESRNAAQLDHPGIVRVYDTGRHEGIPFIVSEFAEGKPLSEAVRSKQFEFHESASLVLEILSAISHAHQRGVIHRDLKPSNIMVQEREGLLKPRVMDFGLARREQSDVSVTLQGQALGTPAYMSPEQARGDLDKVDARSDVYSVGVMLFQLLCGELPFRGNTQRLIQQVIEDDPPQPSRFRNRIPRDLENICMKAISRELADRYSSIEEFGNDLSNWISGKPVSARRIGPVGVAIRWFRRRPTVAALVCFLALSVVGGVSGIAWQWREAESARMASEADLSDALESVDRVLGHLGSSALADVPQAKQLRAEVLADALLFFDRFRQRNPDDPRVEMQVAEANYQIARIQNALGKVEEARIAFKAAMSGYEKLKGRALDRKEWQDRLAFTYAGYANFLLRQSEKNAARELQRKCFEVRKQLSEENPKSGKFASKLAASRADLARMENDFKDLQKGTEVAIEELNSLVEKHDEKIGYKNDLARVLNNYSIDLVKKGMHAKAERCRERAIELFEIVIADDPNDERKQATYANCCLQLVRSLREESRVSEARKYQQKALDSYRRLTEDFPATPRHRERFASVLAEIGDLAVTQKRTEDAISAYEGSVRQTETLVALFPNSRKYKVMLVDDLYHLSDVLVNAKRSSSAEDRLRQMLELRRAITDPESDRDKIYLARSLNDLAKLIARSKSQRKKDEATALREEASSLIAEIGVEEILNTDLSNARKIGVLDSLLSLAKKQDDVEVVEGCYRAKIKLFAEGVEENPKSLKRRSALAKLYSKLGLVLRDLDRREEAVDAYREALKVTEELLRDDPDSATYASQMIGYCSSLGQILLSINKPEESIPVIEKSLKLCQKLYEERKEEPFRKVRLVLAYTQLGNSLAKVGNDFSAALDAYEKALPLVDAVGQQPGMERFKGTVLNSVAWLLVTCPDQSLRDPERALELSRKAVEIDRENATNLSTLAFSLFETGQHEEAISQFKKSTSIDPGLRALNTIMMAQAKAKLGDPEEAKKLYEQAVSVNEVDSKEPELFEIYRKQAQTLIDDPSRQDK